MLPGAAIINENEAGLRITAFSSGLPKLLVERILHRCCWKELISEHKQTRTTSTVKVHIIIYSFLRVTSQS